MDLKFTKGLSQDYLLDSDIYAVDKGLEICNSLDLTVKKIIGDFDSVNPEILNHYPISLRHHYPKDKNQSDAEIAIQIALEEKYQEIFLLNADGARVDHFLFNALLLFMAPIQLKMITSTGTLMALKEQKIVQFQLQANTTFSLIPLEKCTGVTISGCKFPLKNTQLHLTTLSLSNIALGEVIIHYSKGKLLFFTEDLLL